MLQQGRGGEGYLIEQDVRWIVARADGALHKPGPGWAGWRRPVRVGKGWRMNWARSK